MSCFACSLNFYLLLHAVGCVEIYRHAPVAVDADQLVAGGRLSADAVDDHPAAALGLQPRRQLRAGILLAYLPPAVLRIRVGVVLSVERIDLAGVQRDRHAQAAVEAVRLPVGTYIFKARDGSVLPLGAEFDIFIAVCGQKLIRKLPRLLDVYLRLLDETGIRKALDSGGADPAL